MTRCGQCGSGLFQLEIIEPAGSTYKLNAVQCSSCGAPFGVTDYYNVGTLLHQQSQAISDLGSKIDEIQRRVRQMAQAMRL